MPREIVSSEEDIGLLLLFLKNINRRLSALKAEIEKLEFLHVSTEETLWSCLMEQGPDSLIELILFLLENGYLDYPVCRSALSSELQEAFPVEILTELVAELRVDSSIKDNKAIRVITGFLEVKQ